MAMDALGPCALPACTSVLLAHSVSAFIHEKEDDVAQGENKEFTQGDQQRSEERRVGKECGD